MSQDFLYSLEIMWKGMSGVFIVILIITFVALLLAEFTKEKKDINSN